MIKLNKNTGELTRERLPQVLKGLGAESLADLTWTDPVLGLHDFAWLPEQANSPALSQFQRYGSESFELSEDGSHVIVTKAVVSWSQAEIDAYLETLSKQCHNAIKSKVDAKMDNLKNGYAEREIQSWPVQLKEAEALLVDPSAPTPFLSNAKRASETVEEYADKVRANNAAWSTYAGQVVGWRAEMEDALDVCTTEAEYKDLLETIKNA